jgi:hypothetical protein
MSVLLELKIVQNYRHRMHAKTPPLHQFVYPFTLEPHILAQSPPLHEKIQLLRANQAAILQNRLDEAERKKWVRTGASLFDAWLKSVFVSGRRP